MTAEAFFAGRSFAYSTTQDGTRWLMWGTHDMATDRPGMHLAATYAEPADGAFQCKLDTGWMLVAGAGRHSFRHTFLDASADAEANALEMHEALGIPIVTIEEANSRVRKDGVALHSITGGEKRQAEASARFQQWEQENALDGQV